MLFCCDQVEVCFVMIHNKKTEIPNSVLENKSGFQSSSTGMDSPRPMPVFYFKEQTFSTKKERQTPREVPPPTPRPRTSLKSCPPASRLFSYSVKARPQSVSFIDSKIQLPTKHYDQKSNKLYFNQCFNVISKLGSGSFGDVFEVSCKEDGKLYAVKRSKERFRGRSDRLRKLEEVKKHEQLAPHPNCVQFCKAWEERDHLYIQTELCKTSLSHYSEENHDIPEKTVWNYLVDLLLAVKHLHDRNFIHLDIKPENIFISEDGICKLGDFGLVLDVSKGITNDALEGDPKYLAPELMQGVFTKSADIFSLGITILELACDLDLPRGDTTWHQLRQGQIPVEFTKQLSPSLTQVICMMMAPDYRTRPSVDTILGLQAVQKVYKRRLQMQKFQKVQKYIRQVWQWAVIFYCWVKLCFYGLCPFLQRPEEKTQTPERKDNNNLISNGDYSFSDEDVFESEGNLEDVRMSLFKNEAKPYRYCDDVFVTSPNFGRTGRLLRSPVSACESDLRSPATYSPMVREMRSNRRLNSSPTSVRRSPRLAAKPNSEELPSVFTVTPRNLLAEFEKEAECDS